MLKLISSNGNFKRRNAPIWRCSANNHAIEILGRNTRNRNKLSLATLTMAHYLLLL